MKTAVSIPDDVYRAAEEIAGRLGWSRSQFYARALREFIEGQGEDPVTSALDALAEEMAGEPSSVPARQLIEAGAWER